jgi:hypothetical protein
MRSPEQKMAESLLFRPDGHATEVALAAVADGEEAILDRSVLAHIEACDACTERLGAAALLSLRSTETLPEVARAHLAASAAGASLRRPFPIGAAAAALVLAVACSTPQLLGVLSDLPGTVASIRFSIPIVTRSLVVVLRGSPQPTTAAVILQWIAAALFLSVGVFVAARIRSAGRSLEGGT